MHLHARLFAMSIAVAGLLAAACTSMTPAADVPSLDGTAWILSSLPGRTLVPGTTATQLQLVGADGAVLASFAPQSQKLAVSLGKDTGR